MAKRIIQERITKTEMVVNEAGQTFIIDRQKQVKNHESLINEGEWRLNKHSWERVDKEHREELKKENKPNIIQSLVDEAEVGEQYAIKQIVELHKEETKGDFEVKGIWWEMTLNFLKDKALAFIIGALRGLVKDQIPNMIKLADWLIDNLENVIVDQFNKIEEEDTKGVIRNELNQYSNFKRLAEKLK